MNKFISKKILPSLLTAILSFSCFSCTFALKTNHKEDISSRKTATESFGSKVQKQVKKVISNPKFYVPASIIGALSTPSIYSHIRYSRPRDIANVRGETDQEIGGYWTVKYKLDGDMWSTDDTAKTEIENKVQDILEQMRSADCDTDFKKAVFLHDYIYKHCTYDMVDFMGYFFGYRVDDSMCARGCLTNECATCLGISHAWSLLCNSAGIECNVIFGRSLGCNHAWNLVKINKQWYHVDVTFDLFLKATHGKYRWFMLSAQEMGWDHTPNVRRSV